MLEKLDARVLGGDILGAGGGCGVGCERLKAEKFDVGVESCFAGPGAGAGAAEGLGGEAGAADMLKRSSIPAVLVAGGLFVGEAAEEEEKSPQSPALPPKLSFRGTGWEGGEVGFGAVAGLMSKKEPPLRGAGGLEVEVWRVWPVGEVRLEKGEGFAWTCCGGEAKDNEPKASFMPPNDEVVGWGRMGGEVIGGDCIPPNAFMLDCIDCC